MKSILHIGVHGLYQISLAWPQLLFTASTVAIKPKGKGYFALSVYCFLYILQSITLIKSSRFQGLLSSDVL